MKVVRLLVLIVPLLLLFACKEKDKHPVPVKSEKQMQDLKEPLVKVNRILVEKDEIIIKKYIERASLEMKKSDTGLWYQIIKEGTGTYIEEGSRVTLNYEIKLLDGTLCYNTDSLGSETFDVGIGDVEVGLDEGIRLLKNGGIAKFIMPPHLAHGLLGDDDKIPVRAILIFDIEVLFVD